MDNGLYFTTPSNSGSVAVLENFVDDLVAQLEIGEDVYNLMTCLNEVITNATTKYKQDPTKGVC
jgi:serine/threonine-protein kinase RsbW